MTLLSHTAIALLAEQFIRANGPMSDVELLKRITSLNVEHDRADRGVNLALHRCRLVRSASATGPVLTIPAETQEAA